MFFDTDDEEYLIRHPEIGKNAAEYKKKQRIEALEWQRDHLTGQRCIDALEELSRIDD